MIPKNQIEAVRRSVNIVAVISKYVGLRQAGKQLKGCCPFHEDRDPSFSVDPEKQLFNCFGCQKAGDVFRFLMEVEHINFAEAHRRLADGRGLVLAQRVDQVFRRFAEPSSVSLEKWMAGPHAKFLESSRALEELKARGIAFETGKRALLGWLDSGKGIVGPDGEYRDYYNQPWLGFPYVYGKVVRLIKWRVAFSVGKKFTRPAKMASCLYTNNLNPDPLEEIFVVEGEVDALSLWQIGVRACSLPDGAKSRLPKEDRDYLLGFRLIYLCLDNDEEGKACLRRLLTDLPSDRTRIVMLPDDIKDVNELLVKKHNRDLEPFKRDFTEISSIADHPSSLFFSDLDKAFKAYLEKCNSKSDNKWFEWPWRAVDRMAVVEPGQVISIISTRSGMGKTSFSLEAVVHNALHLHRRVGYYSAEMDAVRELIPILTAQLMQRDRNALKSVDVEQARRRCAGAEFYFGYDPDAKNWEEHAALLEMAIRRLGLDVVVIDHLDFIIRDADWSRANAQKSLATKQLKELSRKYGMVFIVLKQSIKQDPKSRYRGDRPADVYDTAGPATTVDDADHAFVLHRNKRSNPGEDNGQDILESRTVLQLGKSRKRGPGSATVSLVFNGRFASFEEPRREEELGRAPVEDSDGRLGPK